MVPRCGLPKGHRESPRWARFTSTCRRGAASMRSTQPRSSAKRYHTYEGSVHAIISLQKETNCRERPRSVYILVLINTLCTSSASSCLYSRSQVCLVWQCRRSRCPRAENTPKPTRKTRSASISREHCLTWTPPRHEGSRCAPCLRRRNQACRPQTVPVPVPGQSSANKRSLLHVKTPLSTAHQYSSSIILLLLHDACSTSAVCVYASNALGRGNEHALGEGKA